MARLPRVVALHIPHHVTQRGNARQFILASPQERQVYLHLLQEYSALHGLAVMGYCLMSNHVHLVVIPQCADSLAVALKQTHGRFAGYWNTLHRSSGHVWQGRYYSCPLDAEHLWRALRYTELNPVRAGLVPTAEEWEWSSAGAHGGHRKDEWLAMELWRSVWNEEQWRGYLRRGESEAERIEIRRNTHTGRPLGSAEFVSSLENAMERRLAPAKAGRRPRGQRRGREKELVEA